MRLEGRELGIGHKGVLLAAGLSPQLYAQELVCFLGPNGVGKTTLLKTLVGLMPALAGEVYLGGEPLAALSNLVRAKKLSLVLTGRPLAPLFPVLELVALGRQPHTGPFGRLGPLDLEKIDRALELAQVKDLSNRFLGQLSDGQLQRVMIARALAQDTPTLVLDEPTAFLDLPHRLSILSLLHQLAAQEGKSILLSTHELDLALRLADRLWVMDGQGNLIQGAPEDLVLSGALGQAFGNEGFDPLTGGFTAIHPLSRGLILEAEGLEAVWAKRALARAGWAALPYSQTRLTKVQNGPWVLTGPPGNGEFVALGDLVRHLRGR